MTTARKIIARFSDIQTFSEVVAKMTAEGNFGLNGEGFHDQGSS
jgi:hypothetical protein